MGGVQNRTVQKTRRVRVLALSLVLLNSLPALATRPPTRERLTWKPVRWTLALKPTIWRSPRPCQSRNIAEPAASTPWFQHGSPVTSRSSYQIYHVFPNESHRRNPNQPTWFTKQRTEATRWTHAGNETKATACLTNRKQVSSISISDWTGKFDLNAVTKPRHLSWSFLVGSSYEIGKSAILSTLTSELPYACVYVCVLLRILEY